VTEIKRAPRGARFVRLGVRQRAVVARMLDSKLGLVYPTGRENEALYALHMRGLVVPALGFPGAWRLARPARDSHHLRQTLNLHRKDK
jgi:hypothetical protein